MTAPALSVTEREGEARSVTDCPATDPRCEHSRPTDYGNYHCRCEPARRAFFRNRKKAHLNRTRRVDATGTRRRLQALNAIGWSGPELARRMDVCYSTCAKVMYLGQPTVTVELHAKVCGVYDLLWNRPGRSSQSRRAAARHGWLPPLWWDDDRIDDPTYNPASVDAPVVDPVAVDRACTGEPIPLTRDERIAAVHRLTRQGRSQLETARLLHVHAKQVARDLAVSQEQQEVA